MHVLRHRKFPSLPFRGILLILIDFFYYTSVPESLAFHIYLSLQVPCLYCVALACCPYSLQTGDCSGSYLPILDDKAHSSSRDFYHLYLSLDHWVLSLCKFHGVRRM
ncbi:hypothetical protein J3R30DRAFT_200274 [Lentinula aciculospora]|uniref:Uncharacterized protein n=1 Tax=Lentinula aciculospora TaxID=153920 RepID=A0A9W9ABT0_9AGAR|nr:hypothetical protein J3R30DRAFT_200274 [Lentinula aciculospora]